MHPTFSLLSAQAPAPAGLAQLAPIGGEEMCMGVKVTLVQDCVRLSRGWAGRAGQAGQGRHDRAGQDRTGRARQAPRCPRGTRSSPAAGPSRALRGLCRECPGSGARRGPEGQRDSGQGLAAPEHSPGRAPGPRRADAVPAR